MFEEMLPPLKVSPSATDVPAFIDKLDTMVRSRRLPIGDEIRLDYELDKLFREDFPGILFEPEYRFNKYSRIDYYVPAPRVGIEVKVDGSPGVVYAQLARYAREEAVGHLVLITAKVRLAALRHHKQIE